MALLGSARITLVFLVLRMIGEGRNQWVVQAGTLHLKTLLSYFVRRTPSLSFNSTQRKRYRSLSPLIETIRACGILVLNPLNLQL